MPPKVEARILQSLAVKPDDTILEIGTGCAYTTALLARAGGLVHSVDIFPEFTQRAEPLLKQHGLENVQLATGDAIHGWEDAAPYDVIAVTGSVPILTDHFQQQLSINGRLFVIVGESPVMEALLITRTGENEWSRESLFETDIPALIGAATPSAFHF